METSKFHKGGLSSLREMVTSRPLIGLLNHLLPHDLFCYFIIH